MCRRLLAFTHNALIEINFLGGQALLLTYPLRSFSGAPNFQSDFKPAPVLACKYTCRLNAASATSAGFEAVSVMTSKHAIESW